VTRLIDVQTGEEKRKLPALTGNRWLSAQAFSPDGKTLACALWNARDGKTQNNILLRDAETGAERGSIAERPEQIIALAYTPDGKAILALGRDGNLRIWETDGFRERNLQKPAGNPPPARCLAISPDGTMAAIGGEPGPAHQAIRLIDLATGKSRTSATGKVAIVALAFRPDSKALAVAGAEGGGVVSDFVGGETLRPFPPPPPPP